MSRKGRLVHEEKPNGFHFIVLKWINLDGELKYVSYLGLLDEDTKALEGYGPCKSLLTFEQNGKIRGVECNWIQLSSKFDNLKDAVCATNILIDTLRKMIDSALDWKFVKF